PVTGHEKRRGLRNSQPKSSCASNYSHPSTLASDSWPGLSYSQLCCKPTLDPFTNLRVSTSPQQQSKPKFRVWAIVVGLQPLSNRFRRQFQELHLDNLTNPRPIEFCPLHVLSDGQLNL